MKAARAGEKGGVGKVLLWMGALTVIALLIAVTRTSPPWKGFQKPDDVTASRELLAEKFTGPGYFHHGAETGRMPLCYISSANALGQIDRIIKERRLPSGAREKLEKLVRALDERAESRMFGADRVNVLQLNLALEEMK